MLNNDRPFQRLMALLCSIDPEIPLPPQLEPYLLSWMVAHPDIKKECPLEFQGDIPKNAYYVVSGKVKVYAWCPNRYRYLYRIYRENTIVALKCFLDGKPSEFEIVACRNSSVRSISHEHMQVIYSKMEGMKEMALKTALSYSESKEKLRNDLLALGGAERMVRFYQLFKGLLPPRLSPIRDQDIADFLMLSLDVLRKTRRKLKRQGLL